MKKSIIALVSGTLFGGGLAVSGMTNQQKVISVLDIAGAWDPSLLFVMASAIFVTASGFYFILKKQSPAFNACFNLPQKTELDRDLLSGAILFGIGWGLYGYCPGPAIAAISYFNLETYIFLLAMLAGIVSHKLLTEHEKQPRNIQ